MPRKYKNNNGNDKKEFRKYENCDLPESEGIQETERAQ